MRRPRHRSVLAAALLAAAVACTPLTAPAGAKPRAPKMVAPADGAAVDGVPSFSWKRKKKADKYEFQLAADPRFESIVIGQNFGSFQTKNTYATVRETLPNGTYYWRVRSINKKGKAGRWSSKRSIEKNWNERPLLLEPLGDDLITYPTKPLVFRWAGVPWAYKYELVIGTDPSLSSSPIGFNQPIETSGTSFALPTSLAPGRYWWAVTPLNAQKHKGARSALGSFIWHWNSATSPRLTDLHGDPRVFDPQFSWDTIPGAARYEVEINHSDDFAVGSKVCCDDPTTGTSLSPRKVLANNEYHWRIRGLDIDGNAGDWNRGVSFRKDFDHVDHDGDGIADEPTVPNLHLRDNLGDPGIDLEPGTAVFDTHSPILKWDPVPGASSYQVQVVPYFMGGCNWTAPDRDKWDVKTASTAWTPLSKYWNQELPGGVSYPGANNDVGRKGLVQRTGSSADQAHGESFCARVAARSDRDKDGREVVSDWTQFGGFGGVAFRYLEPTYTENPMSPTLAEDYLEPEMGTVHARLPLFTWKLNPNARTYFVVVAKDANFTEIIDVAITRQPAYAPRAGRDPKTYPDETTRYYWAVVPALREDGNFALTQPSQNSPRHLFKQSVPPTRLEPGEGADVTTQPTFRWTPAEGAREYRLQVAQDPTFNNLIDDVTTAATSFTSSSTYPADTVVYWRVRANDEQKRGLTWSSTGTFRRRLPIPVPSADNPTSGNGIPVFTWSQVEGATSYEMHVDQADGSRRDFRMRSTAFTPTAFYGTGIWHWSVRARFPTGGPREVAGGYSSAQPFTRHIDTPEGAHALKQADDRILLLWEPTKGAKQYRVEISHTDSFSQVIERETTDNTRFAPKLINPLYGSGGKLYWRVAAVDEGNNVGGWVSGAVKTARRLVVTARAQLRRGAPAVLRVDVRDGGRKPVKGAKVRLRGAGIRAKRRTNSRGQAMFKIKPRKKGKLKIRAVRSKYRPGKTKLKVR